MQSKPRPIRDRTGLRFSEGISSDAVLLLTYGSCWRGAGRVEDPILAHALTNALIAAEMLILGHWGLGG